MAENDILHKKEWRSYPFDSPSLFLGMKMKLCFWDSIFGIFPPEKAWHPDDEEGAFDRDGNWICDRCKHKYDKAKAKKRPKGKP